MLNLMHPSGIVSKRAILDLRARLQLVRQTSKMDRGDKLRFRLTEDAVGIKVKRIVLLLQALTCLVVITVNGIVLYQFLNRAGCTILKFDFTKSDNFTQNAVDFGDCVRKAVNHKEFPKKELPVVEPLPSNDKKELPVVEPLPSNDKKELPVVESSVSDDKKGLPVVESSASNDKKELPVVEPSASKGKQKLPVVKPSASGEPSPVELVTP